MRLLPVLVLLTSASCAGEHREAAPALATTAAITNMHTATNPGGSFDSYRTFSFGPTEGAPSGYLTTARSAEVQRRLAPLITAALTQKGYVPATAKGDIVIMFGAGVREEPTSSPQAPPPPKLHEASDMGWLPDDEEADFVEGSLVIDAFDGAGGHWVWHGASRANIDPDRIDDERLRGAVRELLGSFPDAATGATAK
jgi:hypothetical protein